MPPALTLPTFVARWRTATLTEQQGAQSHFRELCEVLGVDPPTALDQSGAAYTFEKGLTKSGGGHGRADVWKRGFFAWEYKGPGKDLDAAYTQLLQYRDDLENPPLLVVSDFNRFRVFTNFTNTAKRSYFFDLNDLLDSRPTATSARPPLDVLRALFTAPDALHPIQTTAQVTQAAAEKFALLAKKLRGRGVAPPAAAQFLMRLLFCLFAEDSALLSAGLFTRLLGQSVMRTVYFDTWLGQLFTVMATGGLFGAEEIRPFNGGLFADGTTQAFDSDDILTLMEAAKLDWASVEPSIFGTLFERGLDPTSRTRLGAHYTSRADIELIVEPVLMAPLRRDWAGIQSAALLAPPAAQADPVAARSRLAAQLTAFRQALAATRVLDPACGSGNFLYVALKALLTLEKEVIIFGVRYGLPMGEPTVRPEQLFGIEVNPYAQQLASIVVWIGYIQWMRENGFPYDPTPVLRPLTNIQPMDAILAYDSAGRPVEPPWPAADVIIGNPPFLGGNRIRKELGDTYVSALFKLYDKRVPAFADLVCYWFERARALISAGQVQRAGLLATNSIRGGVNRQVLERIKATGDIFWAQSDRDWVLDGAAVRVSMVGFDQRTVQTPILDGRTVLTINSDLTATSSDLTTAKVLSENQGISFQGPSPKAPFDIDADVAQAFLKAPLNINSKPNSDVVRPMVSAIDLAQGWRNHWTIDFGLMSVQQAAEYEAPFEYINKQVYPVRMLGSRAKYAGNWWQYGRPRVEMRKALEGLSRYIATPRHSKYRIFVWLEAQVLANDATIVFARADDYFLGILHSKYHELWALQMGTSLEDRPRYTPTTTFETFPFPWPPGTEPVEDARVQAIAGAARALVTKRDAWLHPPGATATELKTRTLTALYNTRPTWLVHLHATLDEAVAAAYGWPADLPAGEILARLLALNALRSTSSVVSQEKAR